MTFDRSVFTKAWFWIAIFALVRLYSITDAPLEVSHNWRQTTVTMAARNFLEVDNDPFYPRVDMAGEKTGITGMEFPVLNYCIYLVAKGFGYQHWYGRLINLLVTSFGLFYFFKLVKLHFKEDVALYSLLVLLGGSLWFTFSRKIMPDTFALALVIAGLYYGLRYLLKKGKAYELVPSFALIALGVLAKLPALFLLAVLVMPVLIGSASLGRKAVLSLVVLMAILPAFWWYFSWVPYITEKFEYSHFYMGTNIGQGAKWLLENIGDTIYRFTNSATGVSGFLLSLFGLGMLVKSRQFNVLIAFSVLAAVFFVFMLKAGFAFSHHDYYITPWVPVMAVLIGIGVSSVPKMGWQIALMSILLLENIGTRMRDFTIDQQRLWPLELEATLDEVSEPEDLIVINSGKYPTLIYFAHRKGWIEYPDKLRDPATTTALKEKGCKLLVWYKGEGKGPELKLVHSTEEVDIFEL